MVQQKSPIEVNNFSAGLNTDANPVNFPPNSMKDCDNVVINRNGKLTRRFGMNYESNYSEITTSQSFTSGISFNTFKWDNVGGSPDKSMLAVQVGNELKIFDLDISPISNGLVYTKVFSDMEKTTKLSLSQADSFLVAVNGNGIIYTYEYDSLLETFIENEDRIVVRDLWGVEDITDGVDLRITNNITKRPDTLTGEHAYNLRNQSFGVERVKNNNGGTLTDPISDFYNSSGSNIYPSNSDSVNYALYPQADDTSRPSLDKFWPEDLINNKIGTYEAPRGYFLIDILTRGASRISAHDDNQLNNTELTDYVDSLPQDETSGGATVVTEFGGRIFYAGFSGLTTDGDSKSPNLGSYVAFSRLVTDSSDLTQCYQKADPTSNIDNDIVATDGGFIRIDGAFNILSMQATGSSLIVIAQNGIWRVVGGSDYGFSADNYRVDRLSEEGCRSNQSVTYVDGKVLFWGDNGIYAVSTNQLGDWEVVNIIKDRIQELYDELDITTKAGSIGLFDQYERKVRWIYNNRLNTDEDVIELVYDVDLNCFYKNSLSSVGSNVPRVVSIGQSNPFKQSFDVTEVVVGSSRVQADGDDVTMLTSSVNGITRELVYVTVTEISPLMKYTFSTYNDTTFTDWVSVDDTGVDAAAYLVTGEFNTSDFQRRKQVNSLTMHLEKTEIGFTIDDDRDYIPNNTSSCLVQARWDWSDSNNSNRWSTPRQYYRHKRHRLYDDVNSFDSGFSTIVTKDIVRGHGKALSLKFYTEPLKDFRINGWSMIWAMGDNEGD